MRIAYIAPYQGRSLVERRPIVGNLSLAGRVKAERIAELLKGRCHEIEIYSQGEVVERAFKVYGGFHDPEPFDEEIPVYYSSALPVRFVNGFWSSRATLRAFSSRHRIKPFDLVLIYNLKPPQVSCAKYALGLGVPVVLEYEDGAFGKGIGKTGRRITARYFREEARKVLKRVSGCVGVSPDLLAQTPNGIPKLLLRGVVGEEIVKASLNANNVRRNWVVYSGTHNRFYGLEKLIEAWKIVNLSGWELHIAGEGVLTETLRRLAEGNASIVFHGLLNRQENARFLAEAKIGINPHETGHTSGNMFAFKIIEYLAAGTHVITTPMGDLSAELNAGIDYMRDNAPATIAATLREVVEERRFERTAAEAALMHFGAEAVAEALDNLLHEVVRRHNGG